jgi:hypothetical protein
VAASIQENEYQAFTLYNMGFKALPKLSNRGLIRSYFPLSAVSLMAKTATRGCRFNQG